MNISVAMLCDFAQVRSGLLFISSGGVSQLHRPSYPAPLGVMLALAVEVSELEGKESFEVRVRVEDADGHALTQISGNLQVGLTKMTPGETRQIPFALDLRPLQLPAAGRYMVRSVIPGHDVAEACLSFRATTAEPTLS